MSARSVPVRWRADIEEILISPPEIARRIRQLSREITRDFQGTDLVVVAILNGTVLFLADLIRHLSLPLRLDFVGVSSYGNSTSPGPLVFTKELRLDVRQRQVLLVDDILDSGRTLHQVSAVLQRLQPQRLRTCVLLKKNVRRALRVQADYVGFSIPNRFVVGYGLDFAERYRNLPFIGALHPRHYSS